MPRVTEPHANAEQDNSIFGPIFFSRIAAGASNGTYVANSSVVAVPNWLPVSPMSSFKPATWALPKLARSRMAIM